MSTTLPPAGWYQRGDHDVLTWWDGHAWGMTATEYENTHTEPVPTKVPTRIYWTNLFRFRTLWFLFAGPLVGGVLIYMVVPIPPTILWLGLFVGMLCVMLTTQMACHACGTQLRITRLTGGQLVCHKCGHETDKSLARTQIQN
ncbi:hypothetical protein SEA_MAGRITTE_150 [Microbacterium phage Magritte]|nr:hypothetical protein SEA_MAGRITTE_150 [Microbacterium phage Magritte]